MSRLRQRIAERLVEAQQTAAILTTFNEVDMSALMALRRRHKERSRARTASARLHVVLRPRRASRRSRDVPVVNAQIDGDDIVYHATCISASPSSTERGLVVPVVRDADALALRRDRARRSSELRRRARDGKLAPDDSPAAPSRSPTAASSARCSRRRS